MNAVRASGPFFEVLPGWLPTARQLTDAGLPAAPLAAVSLDIVRITAAGKWHPVPPGPSAGSGCPRVRRAAAAGRAVIGRRAGLLAGLDLCRDCTARVRPPGLASAYLDLARHVIAAAAWTRALEQAAPSADWPACLQWTARTPFTPDGTVPALACSLAGDPDWEPARQAAVTAWQHLQDRADAAQEQARLAAGPPGLRAHAAAARAIAAVQPDTVMENELIGRISAARQPWRQVPVPNRAWGAASQAWIEAICLDADPAAARTALTRAVEQIYATAQVRDIALLPPAPAYRGADFCTPAEWANAEYQAVRQAVTRRWHQRLETALAEVHDQDDDAASQWRLLAITGWPPREDRDRELAYLGHYPELTRTPHPPVPASHPGCPARTTVVLHVPGYAARHATAHHSPTLTATAGAGIPAGSAPRPDQIEGLLRYAAAIHDRHRLPRPGRLATAHHHGPEDREGE